MVDRPAFRKVDLMKIKLDYTDSKRPVAPTDEYQLKMEKMTEKNSKSSGRPMFECDMSFLTGDFPKREQAKLRTWISLAPNALFTLVAYMKACEIEKECAECDTRYEPQLDECTACGSAMFNVDKDELITGRPWAVVEQEEGEQGPRNSIKKFIAAR